MLLLATESIPPLSLLSLPEGAVIHWSERGEMERAQVAPLGVRWEPCRARHLARASTP